MDSMHSTPSMYYEYDAHVKGELLVIMKKLSNDKAVRLRFSDPMIQPEPEGSTQGYPLVSVEALEHAEYDESNTYVLERFNTTAGNPVKKILLKLNLSDHRLFKDGGRGTDIKGKRDARPEVTVHRTAMTN
ncbi:hypothetical protein Tco_0949468 [Tanacetum coccineum]